MTLMRFLLFKYEFSERKINKKKERKYFHLQKYNKLAFMCYIIQRSNTIKQIATELFHNLVEKNRIYSNKLIKSIYFVTEDLMETKKEDCKKTRIERFENVYPHAFWLEKFNKEKQFRYPLFGDYLPNVKNEAFAPKFYSKYSEIDFTNSDYKKFLKLVENSYEMEMDRSVQPLCQNQEFCVAVNLLIGLSEQRIFDGSCSSYNVSPSTPFVQAVLQGSWYLYAAYDEELPLHTYDCIKFHHAVQIDGNIQTTEKAEKFHPKK
ncbi:hypothetical protein Bhyg_10802 [Pseudolycoriella hygida]|uniref:Uncharacterized protein n=1 Tax=Pseudolycoriella hygida TaxID=35572 RepID=A0A9Q0MV44_9DIPT|nr:hypothetical protein Bhyg_10802 [Pseudolycoriella hygida]